MSWNKRPIAIKIEMVRATTERIPKTQKPKPNARKRANTANGIDPPAAMKLPTAPAMKRDRFGVPRGRGCGGAGIAHPGTIGGGYAPLRGAYGIPPEGCM